MKKQNLSVFEQFVYFILVILSFGVAWGYKIVMKKAIYEMLNENNN